MPSNLPDCESTRLLLRLVGNAVADDNADVGYVVADDVYQPVSLRAVHDALID